MRRLLLVVALGASLLGLAAGPAEAAPRDKHVLVGAEASSGLLHWRRSTGYQTVVRVIWRGTDSRWLANTKRAVSLWNRSSRIWMVMSTTCPPGRNCAYVYTVDQGRNGVLGTANSCGGGGHLWTSAGSTCNRVTYNTAYATYGDPNLACHELGHTLGLPHTADGSPGPCLNGNPKQLDYDNLRLTYAHRDSTGPPGVPAGYGQ